jgi:hypothetical protein
MVATSVPPPVGQSITLADAKWACGACDARRHFGSMGWPLAHHAMVPGTVTVVTVTASHVVTHIGRALQLWSASHLSRDHESVLRRVHSMQSGCGALSIWKMEYRTAVKPYAWQCMLAGKKNGSSSTASRRLDQCALCHLSVRHVFCEELCSQCRSCEELQRSVHFTSEPSHWQAGRPCSASPAQ